MSGTSYYDALIIGAGLAGLSAASALIDAGADVLVLEARCRAGGRLLSGNYRSAGISIPMELGGELVATFHSKMHQYCGRMGVPLRERPVMFGGEPLPERIVLDGSALTLRRRSQLATELVGLTQRLCDLAALVAPFDPWSDRLSDLSSISVDSWLHDQRYSRALRVMFSDLAPGSQSMTALLALVAAGGGECFFTDTEAFALESGGTTLVGLIAAKLAERIWFNSVAVNISRSRESVVVEALAASGRSLHRLRTRSLILAIPPSTWHHVHGFPAMVRRLPNMSMNRKVVAVVSGRSDQCPGWCLTNLACRVIDWIGLQNEMIKVTVHVCPHFSGIEATQSAADIADLALRIAGIKVDCVISVHEERWDLAPWSRGVYAVLGPGYFNGYGLPLSFRQPPYFFAGDWVVPGFAGFMEGAILSGERAAVGVLDFLRHG